MIFKNRIYTAIAILAISVCFLTKTQIINAEEQAKEQILSDAQIPGWIQDAATSPPADPARSIITRQLDAIRNRDADGAFSLMTDALHDKFKNAGDFLGVLHFEYRPIYNYVSYKFLSRHGDSNSSVTQKVEIETRYGEPVIVIYRTKKQDNGIWLIDSFTILDNEAQPI